MMDAETLLSTQLEALTQRRTDREHKKIENLMKNTYSWVQSASKSPVSLTSRKFDLTFRSEPTVYDNKGSVKDTPY